MGARKVTSADVAAAAGVSRATVSYVLNDTPGQSIPEATRQRVLDAARGLGYLRSAAARTLRRGRSDIVLFVLPAWPLGEPGAVLINELTARLAAHDLTLVTHQMPGTDQPFAAVWRAITPAAVIAAEPLDATDEAAIQAAGIPIAYTLLRDIDATEALPGRPPHTGRLQAEHVIDRGHRRLAYVLPDDPRLATFAQPRLEGVRGACAQRNRPAPDVQTATANGLPDDAIRTWRGDDHPVTGVCAYNDEMAFAVLAALHRHDLDVPGDVAVVGVDDISVARHAHPPLTTVTLGQVTMARYLTDVVVSGLEGRQPPPAPGLDTLELVVRQST
jgi:DNA-binding LacI/PurR family transcriptional regulator